METTTKEGFFMNALRLAPRRMAKALAAGAVMVAAALPLAMMGGAVRPWLAGLCVVVGAFLGWKAMRRVKVA